MYFKIFSTAIVKIDQGPCIKFSCLLKTIAYPINEILLTVKEKNKKNLKFEMFINSPS